MKSRFVNGSRKRGWTTVSSLIAILAAFFCLQPQCRAQQQSSAPSAVSADPLKYVNWISGPQNVTLENVADINIPDGCRVTDVHGARLILVSFNDAIPDDLVGIIAPNSGKWMAILEYSRAGYVRDPDVLQINTNAVLKQVLDQMNAQDKSSVAALAWQSEPAYDSTRHTLDWSLVAATPASRKVLSQTAALLGRHGVFQITIVQPFSSAVAPPLKQLAGDITFKNGERYIDYKTGDQIADLGLAELILGENEKHAQSAGLFSGGFGTIAAWIYGGLAVCLITGGAVMFLRRNKIPHQRRHRHGRAYAPVPAPEIQNKVPVNYVPSNQLSLALKHNESNGHAGPKPVSIHGNGWKPFRRKHRKRIIDYSKFYMNVTRDLTRGSYSPASMPNGKSWSNGHTNGHANGHSNGDSNGHAAPNGANENQTMKPEIAKLIASQQCLIEEQKTLLEQQIKLLEEKTRLIEEQTAFLKSLPALNADRPRFPLKPDQ